MPIVSRPVFSPPSWLSPSLLSFLPSIRLSIICYLSKHPSFPLKYQCLPKHGTGHWTTKVNKTVMVLLAQIVQSDGKQASTQVAHHHTAQQCNGKKKQSVAEAREGGTQPELAGRRKAFEEVAQDGCGAAGVCRQGWVPGRGSQKSEV